MRARAPFAQPRAQTARTSPRTCTWRLGVRRLLKVDAPTFGALPVGGRHPAATTQGTETFGST
eukprot:3032024-Pyramimonas_sp.AAC.1